MAWSEGYKFTFQLQKLNERLMNDDVWAHRRPENSSVNLSGLFESDLQIREVVSLPSLRAEEFWLESARHYGVGQFGIVYFGIDKGDRHWQVQT